MASKLGLNDIRYVARPGALAAFFQSNEISKILLRLVQDVEGRAKKFAPVDTGRLRSSISSGVERDGQSVFGYVGSDVEYAIYVEFGTYRSAAQSFLRRALDEVTRGV